MTSSMNLPRLIEKFQVFRCVECGKCTGACPPAQVDQDFSPRRVAKHVIEKGLESSYVREKTWSCLTCGLCNARCPQGIAFTEFVKALRLLYLEGDCGGHLSHGGALHGLMRMQASPRLRQNRLDWVTGDLRIASAGEILYFAGCLPYLENFFSRLGLGLEQIAVDTVKILNSLGIDPVVLPDERCCGHDLVWTGDASSFAKLRQANLEAFRLSGAKTIITACAECSYALKYLYPDNAGGFPFEVLHISEYLQNIGFQPPKNGNLKATYQDPCRLGRFQGIYQAPRELLGSAFDLREMPHYGPGAWCCGNSAWLHCDRYSKQMQVERLREAKQTGSRLMVTACPKCRVHLSCAMQDANRWRDLQLPIRDFSSVMAEHFA